MTQAVTNSRITMVVQSVAYQQKFGMAKHRQSEETVPVLSHRTPKHRLETAGPRHRLWDINQY